MSAVEDGTAPVVAAQDVTRTYGKGETAVEALRGVSLEVARGRLTAVMGPSGRGKSTRMHILAGLDQPTSGHGHDRWDGHHDARRCGADQAAPPAHRFRLPVLQPPAHADRRGEHRAAVDDPRRCNLDSARSGEILELTRDSVDSLDQTTVMVTHDARAAGIADRILFLDDGLIVKDVTGASASEVMSAMEELTRA